MAKKDDKIIFTSEDGEEAAFYVLEQTVLSGESYLLVADSPSEEADALILRERKDAGSDEAVYDVVEDREELKGISKIFEELLEDVDIEME